MQRLLIALLALLLPGVALADSTVHGLATNTTSPLPASSCIYVDQGGTTDTKLCSGWAAALGGLVAASNLSDLTNAATARTNLGLGTLATLSTLTAGGTGVALSGTGNTTINVTGFGVDGGTSAATATGTGTTATATRLETIGTLAGAIVRTLPAISGLSSDTQICYADAAGNVTGTNTLTIQANAADKLNGSLGGSVGPLKSLSQVCFRAAATHQWQQDGGVPTSTVGASTIVSGVDVNGLTYATQTPAQIGASAANHAVPVDVAGTSTYKVVPDCTDSLGNHLNYTQSTDTFSCGTTSSGGGGGGAVTKIATVVPGGASANIDFSNNLGSTYLHYKLACNLKQPDTGYGLLQIGTGATPTYDSTVGHYERLEIAFTEAQNAGSPTLTGSATLTGMNITVPFAAANHMFQTEINFNSIASQADPTQFHIASGWYDGTHYEYLDSHSLWLTTATAITGLRVTTSTGASWPAVGQCTLYGYSS